MNLLLEGSLRGLVTIAARFLHQATPWPSGIVGFSRSKGRWFGFLVLPFCQIQNAKYKLKIRILDYQFEIGLVIKKNIGVLTYYCRHVIFKVHDKLLYKVNFLCGTIRIKLRIEEKIGM